MSNTMDTPHRRRNLLTGEWVVVSPHRTQRPWQGHEGDRSAELPAHDPTCYLCPGNDRAGGVVNPNYKDVFVFDNDFPALLKESSIESVTDGLFQSEPVCGCCRVICYGPEHNKALHQMSDQAIERVISMWIEQSKQQYGQLMPYLPKRVKSRFSKTCTMSSINARCCSITCRLNWSVAKELCMKLMNG